MRRRGEFRLTRAQARGLAAAVRASSWTSGLGDYTLTITHRDGTEVTITVEAPKPVEAKVVRGFVYGPPRG